MVKSFFRSDFLVARTQSNPTLRQALEAVVIGEEKSILNSKEEWSSQPRKRKQKPVEKRHETESGSNRHSNTDI